MIAYAFRSGHIGFGTSVPDGALFIANGPAKQVGQIVRGNARLAYDNETWLVPGCPEAQNDEEAYKAFVAFFDRIRKQLIRVEEPS
jgi:hypothetical protein